MTDAEQALYQFLSRPYPNFDACACMGSVNDEPLCRCMMQMCEMVNGVWYKITETRANGCITHTVETVDDYLIERASKK
jgi:hypothetical protein